MNNQNIYDQDRKALLNHIRRLLDESEKHSQRIMTLSNMSVEIHHAPDMSKVLKILSRYIDKVIHCEYVSLFLINIHGVGDTLVIKDDPEKSVEELDRSHPILQTTLNDRTSKILNDDHQQFVPIYTCKLLIPISTKNSASGALLFASNTPYDGEDLRLGLLISHQIAALIDKFSQIEILLEMQEQLTMFTHDLIEQNEDMATYNHTIAHDLKSPLSIIPVKVDIIERLEKNLSESSRKHLNGIRDQVFYINTIIDQLLILSQVDYDKTAMSVLDVNQIVTNSLRRFVEVETGEITIIIQPDLPKVRSYEQWLEQVFANLIANAIKYRGDTNEQARITITAEVIDEQAIFRVTDNGIGIDPVNQKHIFKMFSRVHEIEAEGYGLGLAIVQRILQKLGGQIGVESEVGKGTCFWFSIPFFNVQDD